MVESLFAKGQAEEGIEMLVGLCLNASLAENDMVKLWRSTELVFSGVDQSIYISRDITCNMKCVNVCVCVCVCVLN